MRGMVQLWEGRGERSEGEGGSCSGTGQPGHGTLDATVYRVQLCGSMVWYCMGAVQRGGGWFGAGAESRKGLGALTLV